MSHTISFHLTVSLQPEMSSFILLLVLCHTVAINDPSLLTVASEMGLKNKGRRKGRSFSDESMRLRQLKGEVLYEGASPDETALVSACRRYGVVYQANRDGLYIISYLGSEMSFPILKVLEFDADRKRMSVVVRHFV